MRKKDEAFMIPEFLREWIETPDKINSNQLDVSECTFEEISEGLAAGVITWDDEEQNCVVYYKPRLYIKTAVRMAQFEKTEFGYKVGYLDEKYIIDPNDESSNQYKHRIETRKEFNYSLGLFVNECDNSINNAIKLANLILAEHKKKNEDYN